MAPADPNQADIDAAIRAFERGVLPALFQASATSADAARAAIDHIRHKLDQLDALLPTDGHAGTTPPDTDAAVADDGEAGSDNVLLGRNQHAKLRELALLEILAQNGRAMPIQTVMVDLGKRGFADKQPAVNAQLHRLRGLDIVTTLGPGMFQITAVGREHLHKLKLGIGQIAR